MNKTIGQCVPGVLGIATALTMFTSTTPLQAQGRGAFARTYEVTITNMTRGQQLTPRLVVVHGPHVRVFDVGTPASAALASLAEQGDTAPLTATLSGAAGVSSVATEGGLVDPGGSHTFRIQARPGQRLTVGAMFIPTNDGFFMAQSVDLPHFVWQTEVVTSPVYDAGSERNDELCASIPGPDFVECGGPGGGAMMGGGEGFVHIHAGVHGTGDLNAAERDWRNPAVRVSVRLVR